MKPKSGCVILILLLLAVGRIAAVPPAAGAEKPAAKPAGKAPEPLVLDAKPEPFVPERPRTEADRDRLEALTLFSTACVLEQRQKYAEALRLYQRAFRCDTTAPAIARSVILLAIRLGRQAEAVRYALKLVDLQATDPLLLQRLGVHLTETGDYARAVTFYERALAARKNAKPNSAEILLRMEMGRLYYLLEKHDKAAEQFARVSDAMSQPDKIPLDSAAKKALFADGATTYGLIGESFLLAGRLDDAVAVFQKADRAKPDKGLLGYNLARVELRKKNFDKALAHLQAYFAARLAVEGLGPCRTLAEILQQSHKEAELIPRLEKLRAADPANAPLGYFLAEQYRLAQQLDKAEPLYLTLVEKAPTLTGFRSLIEIYRKTRRPEALLKALAQAANKTGSLEPLEKEGKALVSDAALVQSLIDTSRKLHQTDPARFNYDMRLAMALVALDAKRYDAAGEFFDLAIQARPERAAELLLTWGLDLLMADKPGPAAQVFRRGLDAKIKPKDESVFHFYLAAALAMDGHTDQALAAARKAAELGKDGPRLLSRVAWVLYHGKRNDEAAKAYQEVIDKFGANYESAEVRRVLREARLALSNLCVLSNKLPQAEEWLEQVLDEFPDDPSALNDLGYLWADANKNLGRAETMIRQAVTAEPKNGAFRDSLGWILYRLGRPAEAAVELEKAVAIDPDPTVLDHLGDACHAAKQHDKARASWQRAAEAFKKQGKQDKAQQALDKAKLPLDKPRQPLEKAKEPLKPAKPKPKP